MKNEIPNPVEAPLLNNLAQNTFIFYILLFIICYRAVISSSEIVFLGDLISEVGFVALGNSFRLSSAGGVFLCFNLDL